MKNLKEIEKSFIDCCNHLDDQGADSLIEIDLRLLHELELLNHKDDTASTRYFKVFERPEKITLVNDDYIVWIVPMMMETHPVTMTLIAKNKQKPSLELTLIASGVYNTSQIVLQVLEKLLQEVEENDGLLNRLK
jgi:GTPase SAR1 family protein